MHEKKPNSNPTKAKKAKQPTKPKPATKPHTTKKPAAKSPTKPRTAKATAKRITKATVKAKRVAEEYVASGGNKAKAARAAGSKAKNATQAANEILKKPEVQAEIGHLLNQARTAKVMEATEVLERLSEQARFDLTLYQSKDGHLNLTRIKEEGKGHCLIGFRSRYNKKTKVLTTEGIAASQQKALFKLADIYGLPQQPRSNTFETVRKSVAEFMAREKCSLAEAIDRLKDNFPIVRKFEVQLKESGL